MNVFAETNTLLNQEGSDIDLSSKINTQKQLNLDNAFVIQLYASWKTLGRLSEENSDKFVELILDKEYNKALLMIPSLKESKMTAIKEASELYLLFQAGYSQNFINRWIEYSATTPFLQTELGLALDQVIGPNATNYLISHGVFLTADKLDLLKKIENHPSKFNYSLQSFKALRGSEKAAEWIGKLAIKDPLRMPLAQSALLFYAKEGKLGASGKILKEVIEPLMTDSSDTEEISLYFMTLGRLLYQAGALDESKKYFDLIPETSRYFLKAKTESLWAHLKAKDFSRTKGELASLELSLFNDKFYPEAYLVSAMANVMLCQFTESRQAINRFINVNKKWAKDIESNISNVDAKEIDPSFFLTNLENVRLSLVKELDLLKTNSLGQNYAQLDESLMPLVVDSKNVK